MAEVEISHAELPEKLEIQEGIQKFLEKYEERWKISSFRLTVKVYSHAGRKKYSFHAKVIASSQNFMAESSSWDVPSTLNSLLKKLEREIGKKLKRERQEKISTSRKILMKLA